jgi:hypothetical protein
MVPSLRLHDYRWCRVEKRLIGLFCAKKPLVSSGNVSDSKQTLLRIPKKNIFPATQNSGLGNRRLALFPPRRADNAHNVPVVQNVRLSETHTIPSIHSVQNVLA